ncbi:hypothetical protein [Larkinella soli]|uniref:hypothetical protein n=1 Tax=Larkinella soli TaxID=1770527 RepID=UPI000FFC3D68|nr:hypothetical protein [Larkinella soli]
MDVRKRSGLLLGTLLLLAGAGLAQKPAIRLSEAGAVEVVGIEPIYLTALQRHRLSFPEWTSLLLVRTEESYRAGESIAVWGQYIVDGQVLRFLPRFPFRPGQNYHVDFQYGDVVQIPSEIARQPLSEQEQHLQFSFQMPRPDRPATRLTAVYPTAGLLPANQLKLYLTFSSPMSTGESIRRVHLLDDTGKELAGVFLRLDQELWDSTRTRLTLLFDPGRIKRGLRANEEEGAPLLEGKDYCLTIDGSWLDGDGRPLEAGFEKRFRVTAPDRTRPDVRRWRLEPPSPETRAALQIRFDEPLDYALAGRCIRVVNQAGRPVEGQVGLGPEEGAWTFTPTVPWQAGTYFLHIDPVLEDRAGNNLFRLFDREKPVDGAVDVPDFLPLRFELRQEWAGR